MSKEKEVNILFDKYDSKVREYNPHIYRDSGRHKMPPVDGTSKKKKTDKMPSYIVSLSMIILQKNLMFLICIIKHAMKTTNKPCLLI